MLYIVVKTYGNGKHMNKVYPMYFEWLSQAERYCNKLNECVKEDDGCSSDKWIAIPVIKYEGSVW